MKILILSFFLIAGIANADVVLYGQIKKSKEETVFSKQSSKSTEEYKAYVNRVADEGLGDYLRKVANLSISKDATCLLSLKKVNHNLEIQMLGLTGTYEYRNKTYEPSHTHPWRTWSNAKTTQNEINKTNSITNNCYDLNSWASNKSR